MSFQEEPWPLMGVPVRRSEPLPREKDSQATTGTVWGNYRGYQGAARHFPGSNPSSHVQDARLVLIESLVPGLFKSKHVLDIGCNAGAISMQVVFNFQAASVTGVDIDSDLVHEAQAIYRQRMSRVRPASDDAEEVLDYFPISAVKTHGTRPQPFFHWPASSLGSSARVNFVWGDFVVSETRALAGPFDVILALSIIKWIHLEHLDEGLVSFFRKCAAALRPGGHLVLELHSGQSYQRAVHKAPHYQENLQQLKYDPDQLHTILSELLPEHGLTLCATSDALSRRINVYHKIDGLRGES